jgi:hypothetical protein
MTANEDRLVAIGEAEYGDAQADSPLNHSRPPVCAVESQSKGSSYEIGTRFCVGDCGRPVRRQAAIRMLEDEPTPTSDRRACVHLRRAAA